MPPPQRTPSLPGATQASKKAFKPPARVLSDATTSRTNISSSATASASPARNLVTGGGNKKATLPGFSRIGLDDIVMTSSDDDDYAAPAVTKNVAAVTKPSSRPVAREPAEPPNKRKRLSRIPSLSSDSFSSPTATPSRQLSPINVDDDDDDIPEARGNEHDGVDDVSRIGADSDEIPLLPAPLLTRLLHESFDDKQMKVSRDANALMARYMDVFVREAVARATLAKKERGDHDGLAPNSNDDDDFDTGIFLDTKDLEEVAPGLVLDF